MPTITRTTNPTRLTELDAKLFSVRTQIDTLGKRSFWLEKFDYATSGLKPGLHLSCIAHAGSTEEFFQLGKIENPSHELYSINELATDRPLKFRFLITGPNDPLLVAFVDNIRPADESGIHGNSLVDIEPADLNGPIWRLEIPPVTPGADKPVLQVERQLFPTAQAAARDMWIGVLVMPEVMRQICQTIVEQPGALEDPEVWVSKWKDFLEGLGVSSFLEEISDEEGKNQWISEVIELFCAKPSMKVQLNAALNELTGGNK